jgi:hypothetical protein
MTPSCGEHTAEGGQRTAAREKLNLSRLERVALAVLIGGVLLMAASDRFGVPVIGPGIALVGCAFLTDAVTASGRGRKCRQRGAAAAPR